MLIPTPTPISGSLSTQPRPIPRDEPPRGLQGRRRAGQLRSERAADHEGAVMSRTEADLELARVYFEVLVSLARDNVGETITYGDLVQRAKAGEPNNAIVQRAAIPTNAGRRLDTLRDFAAKRGLPDLSALVVNKVTGDNGDGFKRAFDGEAIRAQIMAFDWTSVAVSFDNFIIEEKAHLKARQDSKQARHRKRVPEGEARQMFWVLAKQHPEQTAGVSYDLKEAAIKLIMRGLSVPEAIQAARKAAGPTRSGKG